MGDRFPTRLSAEVQRWVRDGLLSAQQAEQILARHPAHPSWFYRPAALFSLIGGALIAAGVALAVAHNWEEIHRWAKVGGLVALMGAAHLSGFTLRDREYPRVGEGLLVVGGGLLLVGIALIGQSYNLSGRPSDPVLLWWALLLPAAYALPSMGLGALGYLGLVTWYLMAIWDRSTLLGSGLQGNAFFLYMAIAAFGMMAFGLGVLHGDQEYRRLRQFLEQMGLIALFGGLLPLGFFWREGRPFEASGQWSITSLVLLALALLAIALAAYWLPQDSLTARMGLPAVLFILLLYLLAVQVAIGFRAPEAVFGWLAILNWFLLFGASLAFILYGARWGRTSWINWGVIFIGVHAVARYFDLLGTMLQTSMLFFTAGAFVLLLGWGLERVRRRLTAQVTAH